MSVDSSLISRYKSGVRVPPAKSAYIEKMAKYFSAHISTTYQKKVLTEILGMGNCAACRADEEREISDWLRGTSDLDMHEKNFMYTLWEQKRFPTKELPAKPPAHPGVRHSLFSGENALRAGFACFCDVVTSAESCRQLKICFQGLLSVEDTLSDFSDMVNAVLRNDGEIIRIISDPLSLASALDGASRWIPLYLTGHVVSYCFGGVRDNLFNNSICVVPGVAAFFTVCFGGDPGTRLAVVTSDSADIAAADRCFDSFLKRCTLATVFYSYVDQKEEINRELEDFFHHESDAVCCYDSLPVYSAPPDTLNRTAQKAVEYNYDSIIDICTDRYRLVWDFTEKNTFIESFPLAAVREIVGGKVINKASSMLAMEPQYYSARDYARHLKRILHLLETRPNYYVYLAVAGTPLVNLYIKPQYKSILLIDRHINSICTMSYPSLVESLWLYLYKEIGYKATNALYRKKSVQQIRQLIRELEECV